MPRDSQVRTQSLKPLVRVGHGAARAALFQNSIVGSKEME
jgi:hypothetical protein